MDPDPPVLTAAQTLSRKMVPAQIAYSTGPDPTGGDRQTADGGLQRDNTAQHDGQRSQRSSLTGIKFFFCFP